MINDPLKQIPIFSSIQEAVHSIFGENVFEEDKRAVFGGDINDAIVIKLSNGEKIFIKKNSIQYANMFSCEANGIAALAEAKCIGTPKIYGIIKDKALGVSGLMMEYLEAGQKKKDYWETFGEELALLHRAPVREDFSRQYGFTQDNYVGLTLQKNERKEDWVTFFRDCRLKPQIAMADRLLDLPMKKQLSVLLDHLDHFLEEPNFVSVLHGDLWSGNVTVGPDGKGWLIDPAVYYGHSETDLAMTQLFGGFPPSFYEAYHRVNPIDSSYKDRKKIYQLYHLLNHVNLFGPSYLWDVADILKYLL
ncbi:MAG: fructosamine kinase family protein [Eubacteriales bacterium]|nr:fructosamine kinase family protein [Eubacteriales bacterium]